MGVRTAVVGASGYAGGELLRLLDQHPSLELGDAGRRRQRRASRSGRSTRSSRLAGRPSRWSTLTTPISPTPRWSSSRCRTAPRRPLPSGCDPAAVVVDLGADFRLADPARLAAVVSGRSRRHLAVRPARAARRPRAPSRRAADRQPGLLRDRDRARSARRCSPPDSSSRPISSSSPRAARPARGRTPRSTCSPARCIGDVTRVQGGRRASAPRRGSAEPVGRRRQRRVDFVHPAARADAARHPGDLHGDGPCRASMSASCAPRSRGYDDEPFVHVLPEGRVAAHRVDDRVQQRARAGRPRRAMPAARSSSSAHRQPRQGRRRPGDPERQPRARPRRDGRPAVERESGT